ncbi:MAG: family 16 glycoside hydrolase [Mangrovibacterium sp.]
MKRQSLLTFIILVFLLANACQNDKEGKWISLFNGNNLDGWSATENQASFRVEDGQIVCHGPRAHLFYNGGPEKGIFKNFELKAMIMTRPGSNSGIFIHSKEQEKGWPLKGYEIQVNNSYQGTGDFTELKKTGSLYGIRNVYYPTAKDNEWFELHAKVVENHIEIWVNEQKVVDYIQPDDPYRPKNDHYKVFDKGQIALQSHDENSTTYFKDIQIKLLPEGEKLQPEAGKEWDTKITKLHMANFPVIDLHVHLKGGLTIEQAIENSLKLGINYGIAPNCGLKFPVTDDASLYAYMDTVKSQPIFRGMQAEGREWVTLFSPKAIAKFDYVFTDAMTWTDHKGRRLRLWIPEETFVDNEQVFMDELVSKIEAIMSNEPVDIYVNPTFLPVSIADHYDQLWTDERIDRLVNVLAKNNVALEINSRYHIPSEKILRKAKEAGVKFTFGTNNPSNELGRLDYSIEMIDKLGLTYKDMFIPRPDTLKPVLTKGLPKKITG